MKGLRAIDPAGPSGAPRPPRARILVVTADAALREALCPVLRAAHYEVDSADDAIAAGYRILRDPPDLVVASADLPWLSGAEFAAALRADDTLPELPVILVCERSEVDALARQAPDCALLVSPVLTDRLLETIRRELAFRRPAR
ncbi:MAG: response regulator [Burkholderiales bacterium]|nr:response regulator [Burkholderiales bacterium]